MSLGIVADGTHRFIPEVNSGLYSESRVETVLFSSRRVGSGAHIILGDGSISMRLVMNPPCEPPVAEAIVR